MLVKESVSGFLESVDSGGVRVVSLAYIRTELFKNQIPVGESGAPSDSDSAPLSSSAIASSAAPPRAVVACPDSSKQTAGFNLPV